MNTWPMNHEDQRHTYLLDEILRLKKENDELKKIMDDLLFFFFVDGDEVHYKFVEGTNIGTFDNLLEKKIVALKEGGTDE